jgi:hypothetical protein
MKKSKIKAFYWDAGYKFIDLLSSNLNTKIKDKFNIIRIPFLIVSPIKSLMNGNRKIGGFVPLL